MCVSIKFCLFVCLSNPPGLTGIDWLLPQWLALPFPNPLLLWKFCFENNRIASASLKAIVIILVIKNSDSLSLFLSISLINCIPITPTKHLIIFFYLNYLMYNICSYHFDGWRDRGSPVITVPLYSTLSCPPFPRMSAPPFSSPRIPPYSLYTSPLSFFLHVSTPLLLPSNSSILPLHIPTPLHERS